MAIRAVLFDFGGVLTEAPRALFQSLAAASGADIAALAALLIGGYGDDGDHPWHRLERGEVLFQEVCDWALAEGTSRGWRLDLSSMPALLAALPIRPDVVARVRELRAAGYRTALITNNVREFGDTWKWQLPLDELFEVIVDSCELGIRKPDRRIYARALERLGVKPAEAVFLDDFEVNVEGARRIGMRGILVGDDWRRALTELDELLAADRLAE